MKAYKSLEAYNYVVSGHVHAVMSNYISDDCPFIALKTKVTPSQIARDKPHEPWVYLEKKSGAVYCAHCTCMAGLGEVCSHVAALLYKVEVAVKMGLTQTSSTSQACQWNNKFRKEVTPTTVTEIFNDIKGRRTKPISSVQANGSAPLPPQSILDELYAIAPNAAFFTCIPTPDNDVSSPDSENTTLPKYPPLLSTLEQPNNMETDIEEVYNTYSITQTQADNLEKATRNQSVSSLWYQHRNGRVTASKAHDVLSRKPTTSPKNLIKRVAGYTTYDLSKKDSVKWGLDHEDECRTAYTQHQKKQHHDFTCSQSGFIIDVTHPFLGASPDGVINCQCCGKGIVEIKCPYKHRHSSVQDAAKTDKDFCLDKQLKMKKSHRYYTQVQLQMFISKTNFCDFVVYTKCKPMASLVIVRVGKDSDFCNTLVAACNSFIKTYMINELVTRTLRDEPVQTPTAVADNERTWCICSEPEYGRMVRCDGDNCPYEWFHYKCVNIRRRPRGDW